jgi:hypothetical protein
VKHGKNEMPKQCKKAEFDVKLMVNQKLAKTHTKIKSQKR